MIISGAPSDLGLISAAQAATLLPTAPSLAHCLTPSRLPILLLATAPKSGSSFVRMRRWTCLRLTSREALGFYLIPRLILLLILLFDGIRAQLTVPEKGRHGSVVLELIRQLRDKVPTSVALPKLGSFRT